MKSKKPTVTAHCLVKNEENFVWYAIMSVLPFVDKMIVFDTGSSDKTVSIIKSILKTKEGAKKIYFEEKGAVTKQGHTDLRNEMIKMTKTDWFMILDGDEVWPKEQIQVFISDIKSAELLRKGVVMVNYHLPIIDLDHYTERGHFTAVWGNHGQFTFRAFKNFNSISWQGVYLNDTLYYKNRQKVILQGNVFYSTAFFWHLSKLKRSRKDMLVFFRKKPTKTRYLPKFLQKRLAKRNNLKIPEIFYEN